MNTKPILVTYATRYGSTEEVAETIASTLREAGLEVELQPMRAVKSAGFLWRCCAGSGDLRRALAPRGAPIPVTTSGSPQSVCPVAIFTLGPVNTSAGAMKNSHRQLDKELARYPWLKLVALEIFVGKYDPSKLGFFEKLLPASDHRNWEAIRAWAKALPAQLMDGEKPGIFLNAR